MVKSATTNSGEADAKRATYQYDGFGQVIRSAMFDGATTQTTVYAYDYAQTPPQLASVTDPTSAATAYAYDAFGNVSAVTDALGQATDDLRLRCPRSADPHRSARMGRLGHHHQDFGNTNLEWRRIPRNPSQIRPRNPPKFSDRMVRMAGMSPKFPEI
jgi:YD repeat-containing protein